MVSERALVFFLVSISIIYGKFIYVGKTISGIRSSLALLLSLYIAGKVFVESGFWGLLIPFLIFYLTAIGYYSFLDIQQRLGEFLSDRTKPIEWGLGNTIALVILIFWFGVLPLIAVYMATHSVLLSVTMGIGTSLPFFSFPDFDRKIFELAFNIYTVLVLITAIALVLGVSI